jgi:hypothetical protein
MKKKRQTPKIYEYKSVFMQRVADYARSGHVFYIAQYVKLDVMPRLVEHFDWLYHCQADRYERSCAKEKGMANAVFMSYVKPSMPSDTGHPWILMFTSGKSIVYEYEKVFDARNKYQRIILHDLELVQLPRTGSANPVWTWRFTEEKYRSIRSRIVTLAKAKSLDGLHAEIEALSKTPGFSGVRQQIKKIHQLARSLLKHRQSDGPIAYRFPPVRYVQRLPDTLVKLPAAKRKPKPHGAY